MEATKQVKEQTQVEEQGAFLQSALEQMAETVEALEARLNRVLRSPKPVEIKEGVEADLVPLADFLRSRAWAVHGLRNRITDILDRIEL